MKQIEFSRENQELAYVAKNFKDMAPGVKAINTLLKRNNGLVWKCAAKLAHNVEFDYVEDIRNICRLAILPALENYRFNRGALFVTWWIYRMRASVQEWRRHNRGGIDDGGKYERLQGQYKTYVKKGKTVLADSCMKRMDEVRSRKEIELTYKPDDMQGRGLELDLKNTMIKEVTGVMGDWTINGEQPSDSKIDFRGWLKKNDKKSKLTDMERDVICMYYEDGLTYHLIGEKYDTSREWIRQIKVSAENKLKYILKGVVL